MDLTERISNYAQHLEKVGRFLSYLEATVKRARASAPNPRTVLAYIHRGEVTIRGMTLLLILFACSFLFIAGSLWWVRWTWLFYDLERWELVLGFFDQIVQGLAVYYIFRITLLRAEHVRQLPRDRFVFLRVVSYFVRWLGEFVFLAAISFLSFSLMGIFIAGAVEPGASVGRYPQIGMKLMTLPAAVVVAPLGFAALPLSQAIAALLDVVLSIEQNTRANKALPGVRGPQIRGAGYVAEAR